MQTTRLIPATWGQRASIIRSVRGKLVNTMSGHALLDYVVLAILLLLTLFALGIIGYNEIVGRPPDATMLSVLTFILGFLTSQLGVQRGANVSATATTSATTGGNGHSDKVGTP